jgi:hypothetical protein
VVTWGELRWLRARRGLPVHDLLIGYGRPFAIGSKNGKIRLALSRSPYTYQGVWSSKIDFASDVADAIMESRPSDLNSTVSTLIRSDLEDLLHCLGIYHEEIDSPILWEGVYLVPDTQFRNIVGSLADGST